MCFFLFAGDVGGCGAFDQTREKTHVDLMDFGPPDPDYTHVMDA